MDGTLNFANDKIINPISTMVESFFIFFCNFYKKKAVQMIFDENGQKHCFLTNIGVFFSIM